MCHNTIPLNCDKRSGRIIAQPLTMHIKGELTKKSPCKLFDQKCLFIHISSTYMNGCDWITKCTDRALVCSNQYQLMSPSVIVDIKLLKVSTLSLVTSLFWLEVIHQQNNNYYDDDNNNNNN